MNKIVPYKKTMNYTENDPIMDSAKIFAYSMFKLRIKNKNIDTNNKSLMKKEARETIEGVKECLDNIYRIEVKK